MTDAMEAMEPTPGTATYRSERLVIQPLTIGAAPKIVRLARPVINAVLDLEGIPDKNDGAIVDLALDMIEKHSDGLFAAVAIAIDREIEVEEGGKKTRVPDVAFVQGGDIDEFIELCWTLVEVNRDFFDRRLKPLYVELAKRWRQRNGVGKTASSSSSSAATH